MSVIYYKIWRDVWTNKARTLQVILIIAMGAIAVGMVIGARNLIAEATAISWQAASPAMINLQVDPPMNDDELLALKKIEGVAEVEGVLTASFEWRLTPADKWQVGVLYARDDYADQKMNTVQLVSGEWPHQKNMAVGEGFDTAFGVYEGDNLQLKINDQEYEVLIEGAIYDAAQPPVFVDALQLYATRERFSQLTGQENFNIIQTRDSVFDQAIQEQADLAIQDHLDKLEIDSAGLGGPGRDRVVDPHVHPFQDNLDTIFWILGVMGGLTIILGLFLVYNTINAILAEQVKQIGMMKAIGARAGQILWIYLSASFIYGLLASLVAIPLGAVGARYLTLFLLGLLNIKPGSFTIDLLAAQIQVGVALLSPLVASLVPIRAGVRLTVREALGSYGLEGAAASLADRLVARLHRVPYTLLLTLGNTFRNKNRVFFLQITLVGSGFVFMTVMGMRDSFIHTFTEELTSIHTYDVTLAFEDPERIKRVESLALSQPGVKTMEMWSVNRADARPATQAEASALDEKATLFGLPLPAAMYSPQLRAGRWLHPDDTYAVVLNTTLASEMGVGVGDWVTFDHGLKRESTWQVVGLLFDPLSDDSAHVPLTPLQREIGSVNRANTLWVQTHQPDPATTAAVAQTLRHLYEDERGLTVAAESTFGMPTISEISAEMLFRFNIFIMLLAIMAVVIAMVGGVGLSGALSLSVLERRREIGVMRAIGASSDRVAGLFIGEGLILGLLSWLLAIPFSIPAAYYLTTQGLALLLDREFVYHFTPMGLLYWLVIVIVLAIVASWFPARSATRLSVRESLAYQN